MSIPDITQHKSEADMLENWDYTSAIDFKVKKKRNSDYWLDPQSMNGPQTFTR